jgi:hypothetical protein
MQNVNNINGRNYMKKIQVLLSITTVFIIVFYFYSTSGYTAEYNKDGVRVIRGTMDLTCVDEKGQEYSSDFDGTCEEYFKKLNEEAIIAAKTFGIYVEEYMDEQKCIITLGVYKENPIGHVLATYKSRKAGDITNCDVGINLLTYNTRSDLGEKMKGLNNSIYYFSDKNECDVYIDKKLHKGFNVEQCAKLGQKLYEDIE